MAKIIYTHEFDFWCKFIGGFIGFIGELSLTVSIISILKPIWNLIKIYLPNFTHTPIEWISGILIFVTGIILLSIAIFIPLSPLPTWLYLRVTLLTPATWQDAKDTSFLFSGSLWYPLTSLKKIPREYRREALLRFASSKTDCLRSKDILSKTIILRAWIAIITIVCLTLVVNNQL